MDVLHFQWNLLKRLSLFYCITFILCQRSVDHIFVSLVLSCLLCSIYLYIYYLANTTQFWLLTFIISFGFWQYCFSGIASLFFKFCVGTLGVCLSYIKVRISFLYFQNKLLGLWSGLHQIYWHIDNIESFYMWSWNISPLI